MDNGLLIVISGPSGAGKGTIYNSILQRMPEIMTSVSVTTRKPRKTETEGVDYYFRTEKQFDEMIAADEFLEYAGVFDHRYGTPKSHVMEVIKRGGNIMLEIDVKGAEQIKSKFPSCVTIFIMPPSFAVLEERLRGRGTDEEESIVKRLARSKKELEKFEMFDYIVFNDDLNDAINECVSIIVAERDRTSRNENKIKALLNS